MRASSYFATVLVALLITVSWVVDGGGQALAHQRAISLAQDAARAGANAVTGHTIQTGSTRLDPHAARAAATAYVAAAGAEGTTTVVGDTVTVTVRTTYRTVFWQLILIPTLHAQATASARLISG